MAVITSEKKIEINEAYLRLKSYAAVARECEVSASTVKKYVISGYISQKDIPITHCDKEACKKIVENFILTKDMLQDSQVLMLTKDEEKAIQELWKELNI